MKIIDRLQLDNFLLYMLSFLLFWQWLKPLESITNTGNTFLFVIFIAGSFLFYFLQLKWLAVPLKIIYILVSIQFLFFKGPLLSLHWMKEFGKEVKLNIGDLFSSNWMELSNVFLTLLFFILLWLLCYLLHFWQKRPIIIFIFFLFTVIYIGIIDTFFPYDGKLPMVQTIIAGFFILAIVNVSLMQKRWHVKSSFYKYMISISILIGISFLCGFLLPKHEAQWPDPVPFIKSAAVKYQHARSVSTLNTIGYDSNDEHLGGPFQVDDTPVFQVQTEKSHYWRVETKDKYTGKGWESSVPDRYIPQNANNINFPQQVEETVKKESAKAVIRSVNEPKESHFIYSPVLTKVTLQQPVEISINPFNEKLMLDVNNQNDIIYGIEYEYPDFSIDKLQQASNTDPQQINDIFTQLPEELPARIRELAQSITVDTTNRYDAVKAIERYLSFGDYLYETEDVAIPAPDQDYVDQFLFETKKGYCDNFSSSMAVLLRTLDIPARWVKGYTQGSYVETLENDTRLYEITNENAHSWVEVYFPGSGWVPFEPTRGFTNPFQFSMENTEVSQSADINENEETKPEEVEEKEEEQKDKTFNLHVSAEFFIKGLIVLAVGITLIVIGGLYTKKWWYLPFAISKMRKRNDLNSIHDAFYLLVKNANQYIVKKQDGTTLREYAGQVDEMLGFSFMEEITKEYEGVIYAGKDPNAVWSRVKEKWELVMKEIQAAAKK